MTVRRQFLDDCIIYVDGDNAIAVDMGDMGVTDLRAKPPFSAIHPCPYCSSNDHDPLLHVDRKLGCRIG